MKAISIVIPVYNEEKFIGGLLNSIAQVNYPKENYEVIVVSDGSTDRTAEVVRGFAGVRLIELPENRGRYQARKTGAEAARCPYILFVDSRATVDANILAVLDQVEARAVNGYALGVQTAGLFETFYRAVRRVVFRRFFEQYNQPVYLTPANFDDMPKGTGVFFAEKALMFQAYQDLSQEDMGKDSSDDTKLLRTVVNYAPVLIHPGVKIISYARPSFRASVGHLFARGIKFVDYYLNPSLARFWLVIALPLLALALSLAGLFFLPFAWGIKIASVLGLDLLLTLILARSLREFQIVFFMLPLCTVVFYSGIVWGMIQKIVKYLRPRPGTKAAPGSILKRIWEWIHFQSSESYWIDRYKGGGNSGCGSYGLLAQYKADILNRFVAENDVQTVIEFGCGDGNQLAFAQYPSYSGYDISPDAISLCRSKYQGDPTRRFGLMEEYQGEKADLALSLDVLYHLVENDVFEKYLRTLFQSAAKYTIIYSTDTDKNRLKGPHIKHRQFTKWVAELMPEWELISHQPGLQPAGQNKKASPAEFFFYRRTS